MLAVLLVLGPEPTLIGKAGPTHAALPCGRVDLPHPSVTGTSPRTCPANDSTDVAEYLARKGYRTERFLARNRGHFAVIARRTEQTDSSGQTKEVVVSPGRTTHVLEWTGEEYLWDGESLGPLEQFDTLHPFQFPEDARADGFGRVRELLLVRAQESGVVMLRPPEPIELFTPTIAEWLEVAGRGVDGFSYTLDNRFEGALGTRVFLLEGDSLVLRYKDRGDRCRPSSVEDVDGDGTPEILSYVAADAVLQTRCRHVCWMGASHEFGAPAAWVEVRRFNEGEWVVAESSYPTLYRELASRYRAMARYAAQKPDCEGGDFGATLTDWANRAEGLASGASAHQRSARQNSGTNGV